MNQNAPPVFTLLLPRTRTSGGAFATLVSDRGELVIHAESRAVVMVTLDDHMVDVDHLVAQYDARDRFERDAGWGIL